MEIREEQNLFKLLLGSFRLINGAVGTLLVYFSVLILGMTLLTFLPKWGFPAILSSILSYLFSIYTSVAFWRILAAKAENNGESITNSFSASLLPSVYLVISCILLGIVMLVSTMVLRFLPLPFSLLKILVVGIAIVAMTCCAFIPVAIATRNRGPIEAILYSWRLSSRHFFKVLCALLLTSLIPVLFFAGVGYGLYVGIPLFFADSFDLANLSASWYILFFGLGVLAVFFWCAMQAFLLLLFLNLDYGENRSSFTPKVAREAHAELNSFAPPTPEAVNMATQNADLITAEDIENLTVTKSSIKTAPHHSNLNEHLDQVYQPRPEDLAQYTVEEDRMPTILFDDDMARQIEENRKMMEQQAQPKQQEDKGEDSFSIKMSK